MAHFFDFILDRLFFKSVELIWKDEAVRIPMLFSAIKGLSYFTYALNLLYFDIVQIVWN